MSRGTDSSVLTDLRSTTPAPVWLVQIATGLSSPAYIRRTSREHDVTFNSVTYSAGAVEVGEQRVEGQAEAGGVDVRLADADGVIGGYIDSGATFKNQRVRIDLSVDAATGGAGSYAIRGDYLIENYERIDGYITFHCRDLLSLFNEMLPRTTLTRNEFPGLPPSDTA